MNPTLRVILLTAMAGAAIPVGGWLGRIERIHPKWLERELRHFVIALGGGVLLAAVALVLVPDGIREVSLPVAIASMLGGGLAFMGLDIALSRSRSQAAQLTAMLADFVPEAAALGASVAFGSASVTLLAVLIAMQNLPEGFNAYRELAGSGHRAGRTLAAFCALATLGPIAGLLGLYVLAAYPAVVGVVMLSASGGILYLMFQDIAPQSTLRRHWAPPLGAVIGFLIGLIGQQVIQ